MRALALALLVTALAVAGGCGGDDDGATTQDAATTTTEGSSSGGQSGGGQEDNRGGEKSIEEFGDEADETDREAILGAFDGYLTAVAEDDFAAACSHLSAAVQESLQQLVPKGRDAGCTEVLPQLLAPTAGAISREQANGKITRVRVGGDQAFVVFKAPGAKLYQLGLVDEDGEWKATTVAAAVLVPDL
jgi:hypothetical protein